MNGGFVLREKRKNIILITIDFYCRTVIRREYCYGDSSKTSSVE